MKAFHNKWFVFFSMMFLFKPGVLSGISSLGVIDSLFDVMRILLCFICCLLLIKSAIPLNKASIVLGLIACNEVWKILSSLINGTTYTDWGSTLNVFGISIFTYLALRQSAEAFFKGGSLLLGSYVVINTLTVFLFPNGLYASSMYTMNFFLSYRTAWFVFYLEAAFLCLLNNELYPSKEAKNWLVFVLVCEYLSMIKVWTATGLFCITLGLLLVYLWKKKRIPLFSVKAIILGEIVLCAIIVLFHMQDKFSFLIVGILKKDITFSQRVRIWNNALNAVLKSPWIGYGAMNTSRAVSILGYGVNHAHCYYLNTALYYGIIGLGLGLYTIYYAFSGQAKNKIQQSVEYINLGMLIALMTAFQVESMMSIGYYLCMMYIVVAYLNSKKRLLTTF